MTTLELVLGGLLVAAVLAIGVLVWMLMGQLSRAGTASAELATALEQAASSAREREALRAQFDEQRGTRERVEREIEALRAQVTARVAEAAQLATRLEGVERRSVDERASWARQSEDAVRQRDALHAAELSKRTEVHAKELQAVREAHRQLEENLKRYQDELGARFASVASQALGESSKQFLALAEQKLSATSAKAEAELEQKRVAVDQLVAPIREALAKSEASLGSMERARAEQFGAIDAQLKAMGVASVELQRETRRLVTALREPHVRGRYGELQLQRVCELAGMTAYCDFATQDSQRDDQGNLLRPDMVVRLPNGRSLAVDAKTNIQAYLEALEASGPEQAEACLDRFARHVVEQSRALGGKAYWRGYEGSPEFVVMFVPGDQFLDAALSRRPDLLEIAAQHGVIMATPSTLIGLLRAVHVGFAEQRLTEAAAQIRDLAVQLHERAGVVLEHAASLGSALGAAVDRYNKLAGSIDTRLMPTLRRIEEAGVTSGKELKAVEALSKPPRALAGEPVVVRRASEATSERLLGEA